jgi:pyruvate/2-oxoglutarate dehydrogenase complex dihydrolipoamide dehydrogenase (E3) component
VSGYDFDLFTIGAGSGGIRASRRAAAFGARVAVAEQRFLGGTCVNIGCIPKKLLSYAAHFKKDLEDSRSYGWSVEQPVFDWRTLLDAKNREIERLNGVCRNLLNQSGVELIWGKATVTGSHTVEVEGRTFTSKYASFKVRVGALPGQVRAQARRSEHLTRVGQIGWCRAGCGRMRQSALQDNANNDESNPTL